MSGDERAEDKSAGGSSRVRFWIVGLAVAAGAALYVNHQAEQGMRDARDEGTMQACMFSEVEVYGRSYTEATARCEYELKYGD